MIDLRSDTQTRPSLAMRQAIANAEVGDEQLGEDPSVNALEAKVAAMLGHEAAMFLPSGVMANQVATLVHCRPGDEVFVDATSHLIHAEAAAGAVLAGVLLTPLAGRRGVYSASQLEEAANLRQGRFYAPQPRLAALEQTANYAGGAVWSLAAIAAIADAAGALNLATHMDGARLFNAALALACDPAAIAGAMSSVYIDFSKGLGCPAGAALAGSQDFISKARVHKKRLGGAMRQTGILAAAALYALDANLDRLAQDHANAQALARGLGTIAGLAITPPETNIVIARLASSLPEARLLCARLAARGLGCSQIDSRTLRFVTHLDVAAEALPRAIAIAQEVIKAAE